MNSTGHWQNYILYDNALLLKYTQGFSLSLFSILGHKTGSVLHALHANTQF